MIEPADVEEDVSKFDESFTNSSSAPKNSAVCSGHPSFQNSNSLVPT
jgi:hypothetical protein